MNWRPENVSPMALACCNAPRKGFAIRVPKSKDPSQKVQEAIQLLLHDEEAKKKAEEFSRVMENGMVRRWQLNYSIRNLEANLD